MNFFDKRNKNKLAKRFKEGALHETAMVRGDIAALARILHDAKLEQMPILRRKVPTAF